MRVASWRKFRPFRGSSRTCSPVTRPATSPPDGLHREQVGLDGDLLADRAGLELEVDLAHVGDVQLDPGPHRRLEPGELDLDSIAPEGQVREGVDPGRVRGGRTREAGRLASHRDLRPGDHGVRRVGHRAADRGGDPLCESRHRQEEKKSNQTPPLAAHGSPPERLLRHFTKAYKIRVGSLSRVLTCDDSCLDERRRATHAGRRRPRGAWRLAPLSSPAFSWPRASGGRTPARGCAASGA